MTLKRIELLGFKSFATRTVLDFDRGIAGLVGPNGCGKSNVTDAVRWVLGEQNPRLLRGRRAEDVIFAGSSARQPLGMAEASIVLDNADGRLASEFAEVRISRRLYRSGESEYLLNGGRTRLRDVGDVLMRVGIGPDSYCVVGQGAVDEMISQRPEERRALLENAADVRRYRLQLAETTSRLASVEQNLARCRDILAELAPLERRLRLQAGRAERAEALQSELVGVSSAWFRLRFSTCQADVERTAEALAIAEAETRAAEHDLAIADAQLAERGQLLRHLELRLECGIEEGTALEREQYRIQHEAAQRQAQRATLESEAESLRQALREHAARLEKVEYGLRSALEQAARDRALLSDRTAAAEGLELQRQRRHEVLTRGRAEVEQAEVALATIEEGLAGLERQEAETRRARDMAEQRSSLLTARLADLNAQLVAERARGAGLGEAVAAASRAAGDTCTSASAAAEALRELETRLRSLREQAEATERGRLGLSERARALEWALGGERDGAVALQQAELPGMVGVLGSRLVVQVGDEAAVAALLGGQLQALVFSTVDEAEAALEWLQSRAAGPAWVAESDSDGAPARVSAPLLERSRSVCPAATLLSEVVVVPPPLEALTARLLGRSVLVDDLATVRRVAASLRCDPALRGLGWSVAGRDGSLISERGPHRAGRDSRAESLAARGRERASLAAEQEQAERQHEAVRAALAAAEAETGLAQQHARAAEVAAAGAQAESRLAEQQWLEAQRSIRERERELGELQADADRHAHSSAAKEPSWQVLVDRLQKLRAERDRAQATVQGCRRALDRYRIDIEELGRPLLEARASQAEGAAALKISREREVHFARERAECLVAQRIAREALARCERALADCTQDSEPALAALGARREAIQVEVGRMRTQRAEEQQAQEREAHSLAAARERLDRLRPLREAAGLSAARARDELVRLARDLSEFADDESLATLADQPRQLRLRLDGLPATPALQADDPERLRRRMGQLQRELRLLGPTSGSALEEFREVSERCTFLTEQSRDLEQATGELRRAMAELESLAATRLRETFDAVNRAFQDCFAALFGGGQASLVWGAPDEPLASGVEVLARPPGKKPQSLVALSGGERSLTMLALLLALLKVQPTPFCILDEVDAALDDANVNRFVRMLRGFSDRTQFVVVTHNRATMEQADRLYGVSMDSSGVSKAAAILLTSDAAGRRNGATQVAATAETMGYNSVKQ